VTWNTVYMAAVIDQLRAEGRTVNEEDIARLSPARYEHINPYEDIARLSPARYEHITRTASTGSRSRRG